MKKIDTLRTVYNFQNTCQNCFNDIEFPILGDFTCGETIFQTKDAKDFYIAVLVDNKTLAFITDTLQRDKELASKEVDPKKILALLADKVNNKEFATDYPLCPKCGARQRSYGDNRRTTKIEIGFASWIEFERLKPDYKIELIKEVIFQVT